MVDPIEQKIVTRDPVSGEVTNCWSSATEAPKAIIRPGQVAQTQSIELQVALWYVIACMHRVHASRAHAIALVWNRSRMSVRLTCMVRTLRRSDPLDHFAAGPDLRHGRTVSFTSQRLVVRRATL